MRTLRKLLHLPLLFSTLLLLSASEFAWSPGSSKMPYGRGSRSEWGRDEISAEFNPLKIPGCVLWLNAGWGVFQDDEGTTPSPADSVAALWKDRSSNGYNAAQTTNASRPLYKTGIQNGRPVIRFDGVDDHLITPRMEGEFSDGFTWFIVTAVDDGQPANYRSFFGAMSAVTSKNWYFLVTNYPGGLLRQVVTENDIQIVQVVKTLSDGQSDFFVMHLCADPSDSLRGYYNNIGVTPADLTGLTWANIAGAYTEEIAVSGRMKDGSFEYPLDGDIAELIIYERPLTDMEQDWIENYLSVKYGVE